MGVRDLSVHLRWQLSHPKDLKEMEDTMLSGVSLKHYTSELGPAKFLVPLLEEYCLDGSFRHVIFRWTNLDVKWSIDSLPCKVTVLIIAVVL